MSSVLSVLEQQGLVYGDRVLWSVTPYRSVTILKSFFPLVVHLVPQLGQIRLSLTFISNFTAPEMAATFLFIYLYNTGNSFKIQQTNSRTLSSFIPMCSATDVNVQ